MTESKKPTTTEVKPPMPKGKMFAIIAMVVGIVGIVFSLNVWFGFVCAIVAIVLGIVGLNQLKAAKSEDGKGFAIAGIVTGAVAAIFSGIILCFAVALFNAIITGISNFASEVSSWTDEDWSKFNTNFEEITKNVQESVNQLQAGESK